RLRRRLLRGGLLAEASARRLAGFLKQLQCFLQRQRRRFAVLGDLAVELAVRQVRAIAAVEYLHVVAVPLLDDPVPRDLLLLLDQEHRARQVDGVRVVLLLQRGIHAATLGERPEAADADADLLAPVAAQDAGQP